MPLIEARVVQQAGHPEPIGMAQAIAEAVAIALTAKPGSVWVTLQVVPEAMYAENGQTEPFHPVFITVTHAELPNHELLSQEASRLSLAVASAINRPPSLVHIVYAPPGSGRIAFGGKLLG